MFPKYDLVCTGCGFKLVVAMQMPGTIKSVFEAGYCNRCPDQAKLEWRLHNAR